MDTELPATSPEVSKPASSEVDHDLGGGLVLDEHRVERLDEFEHEVALILRQLLSEPEGALTSCFLLGGCLCQRGEPGTLEERGEVALSRVRVTYTYRSVTRWFSLVTRWFSLVATFRGLIFLALGGDETP